MSPSQSDLRLLRLENRALALRRKCPMRLNGKGLFTRDAFAKWKDLHGATRMPNAVKQKLVSSIAARYHDLYGEARRGYARRAASEASEKAASLQEQVLDIHTMVDLENLTRARG